jgi:hypothetical protein
MVTDAFERATGLASDEYWIEARAGGAPSWSENTRTARIAHQLGAETMGWAAHGAECRGYPGESDAAMRRRLEKTARRRAGEFPKASHVLLFALPDGVEIVRIRSKA